MRALVAGGAGFIGSHLCDALLTCGWKVTCVDNLLTGRLDNLADCNNRFGFEFIESNVADAPDVAVDLVLHFASPASPVHYARHPVETMMANSAGTLRLLQLAERNNARFIFASTSEVYGDPLEHPQRESYWGNVNPTGPRACYDESKRFGEALAMTFYRERGVKTTILRLFNTYGPRMDLYDGRVVPTFFRQAIERQPLTVFGDGSQTRSLSYVSDLVRGIQLIAVQDGCSGGVYNIGNPEEVTMLELASLINETAGNTAGVRFEDLPVDDPTRRRPDISAIRERIGWEPKVSLREGLKLSADYFRSELAHQGVTN